MKVPLKSSMQVYWKVQKKTTEIFHARKKCTRWCPYRTIFPPILNHAHTTIVLPVPSPTFFLVHLSKSIGPSFLIPRHICRQALLHSVSLSTPPGPKIPLRTNHCLNLTTPSASFQTVPLRATESHILFACHYRKAKKCGTYANKPYGKKLHARPIFQYSQLACTSTYSTLAVVIRHTDTGSYDLCDGRWRKNSCASPSSHGTKRLVFAVLFCIHLQGRVQITVSSNVTSLRACTWVIPQSRLPSTLAAVIF